MFRRTLHIQAQANSTSAYAVFLGTPQRGTGMSKIVRFPSRKTAAIFVTEAPEGGWLVLARGHGWLHGSRLSAMLDAFWLARNYGFPIRDPGGSA
jgi:hypothetical protein